MECAEPFQLVMQRSDGGKLPARLFQTEKIYLLPRHNMPLQVGFCVNQDLLQCLDTLYDETYQSSEAGTKTEKDVYLELHGTEGKLHFKHDLIIHFNNGSQQKLLLYAKLAFPTLSLSKETIHFSTCLVGQERECQFMLTSPTGSDSYWNCQRDTVRIMRRCLSSVVDWVSSLIDYKYSARELTTEKHQAVVNV